MVEGARAEGVMEAVARAAAKAAVVTHPTPKAKIPYSTSLLSHHIALRWPCTCAVSLAVAQHASNATTATSSIVGTGAHHSDDTPDEAT